MWSRRAACGASALNGSSLIMFRAARFAAMASVTVRDMAIAPRWCVLRRGSVVGVLEVWVPVVVEGADSLDPVRVHRGAPVGLHHDRDRLLDGLAGTHLDRPLDGLNGGRRVA